MKKKIVILISLALILIFAASSAVGEESVFTGRPGTAQPFDMLNGVRHLNAKVKGNTVKLSWSRDTSLYCTGYAVFQCERSKSKPVNAPFGRYAKKDGYYWYPVRQIKVTKKLGFQFKVKTSGKYYIEVVSYSTSPKKYVSSASQFLTVTITPALTAPTNLEGQQIAKSRVKLTWNPGSNAKYYKIYRAQGAKSKNYKLIAKTKNLQYTDKHATNGKIWKYKVYAVNGTQKKVSSVLKTYPHKPLTLKAKDIGNGVIGLQWNKDKTAKKYLVYMGAPGMSNFVQLKKVSKNSCQVGATYGSGAYYFYVIPQNGNFTGINSNVVTVVMKLPPSYRAVVIGQTYDGTGQVMSACECDRAAVANMLNSLHGTPYSSGTIRSVKNGTKAEIYSAIDAVFGQAKSDDVTLLYYSGLGTESGALVGSDSQSIPIQELRQKLDQYKGKKVIILDSRCSGASIGKSRDSGTVSRSDLRQFNASAVQAFRNAAPKTGEGLLASDGYYVITACSGSQDAYRTSGYSYFTLEFLAGLGWESLTNSSLPTMYADENGDSLITLQEAYRYASNQLMGITDGSMDVQVYPASCNEVFFAR